MSGIVGTLISMVLFVIGLSLLEHIVHKDYMNLSSYHTLLLASLLSNWETHTCILILEEKDYPTLTSLMFGETMINDGVIIALANTIKQNKKHLIGQIDVTVHEIPEYLKELGTVSLSSILIGIAVALIISLILRQIRSLVWDNGYLQMTFVLVGGYISFMLSEKFDCAGTLTIFCAGFVLSYYAFNSMSERGQALTKVTVHFLGFLAESFVFAYIGLSVPFAIQIFLKNMDEIWWLASIILGSFFVRAISLLSLFLVISFFQCRWSKNQFKHTIMLLFAGMIRG